MSLTDPSSNPVLVSAAIVFITIQLILISLIGTELMYPPIPQPVASLEWGGGVCDCALLTLDV